MNIKELDAKLKKYTGLMVFWMVIISIIAFAYIFINHSDINELESQNKLLSEKIDNLQETLGEYETYIRKTYNIVYTDEDESQRSNIGLVFYAGKKSVKIYNDSAIQMIMDHLGLEFQYLPEKQSEIIITKKEGK